MTTSEGNVLLLFGSLSLVLLIVEVVSTDWGRGGGVFSGARARIVTPPTVRGPVEFVAEAMVTRGGGREFRRRAMLFRGPKAGLGAGVRGGLWGRLPLGGPMGLRDVLPMILGVTKGRLWPEAGPEAGGMERTVVFPTCMV